MMWKLLVIPLLLIATAVLVPNTAWATHYTYWQENPEDQERWADANKFNAVAQTWSAGPYDTKWAHDGVFPERARAAIQSWEVALRLDGFRNQCLFPESAAVLTGKWAYRLSRAFMREGVGCWGCCGRVYGGRVL